MIWLMLRGELPTKARSDLLEAAWPASSWAASAQYCDRATCGVRLNNAMASALNVLGRGRRTSACHFTKLRSKLIVTVVSIESCAAHALDKFAAEGGRYVPGFEPWLFHGVDPRAPRLLQLIDEGGRRKVRLEASSPRSPRRAIRSRDRAAEGKTIPLNIDVPTADLRRAWISRAPRPHHLCRARLVSWPDPANPAEQK